MRNTNKSAFTMIELIFVIVVIGILAAVALPKFSKTSQAAHEAQMKGMVSNLDNTVFPVIWKDNQASLTKLSAEDANLSKWITPVDEFANDKFV
ncbi:MAG: type II secretion system protein, partial [Epsilonproteobacteria bacterium]|nr:type II secretion system protein [Campylobacterota bacterium]